jgi:uncharacterized protein YbjT (DUF2867 family)
MMGLANVLPIREATMYVVAGITGNTGSVVASTLLDRKAPVRVIVRDPAKGQAWKARGAEVAIADLGDQVALTAALRGASAAYLLVPPRPSSPAPLQENRALIASLAGAVAAAKVPHVVLLSSIGAQHADGTGPIVSAHDAEQALAPITALTAVRAAFFMENMLGSLGALAQNILPVFWKPDHAISMVATADIGRIAATALLDGPRSQQRIELSGPRELSPNDVAAVLSKLTGKEITATQAPLEAVVPTFTGFGLSKPVAELYAELYGGIGIGRVAWSGDGRAIRGTVEITEVLRPALQAA